MKPCKKVGNPKNLFHSILLFCVSIFLLQGQSNMPDDSYTTITKASSIALENPRKSLDILKVLKQKFIEQGSYENIDDFSVYYTIIAAETSIYSREKRFAPIYRAWQEIGEKIKHLRTKDDQYASYYYFSKIMLLIYKAQEKGTLLPGNERYRSEIKSLIAEVKQFDFKEKITQNLVISHLEQYL